MKGVAKLSKVICGICLSLGFIPLNPIQADTINKSNFLRSMSLTSWIPLISDVDVNPYDENLVSIIITVQDVPTAKRIFDSLEKPYTKVLSTENPGFAKMGMKVNRDPGILVYTIRKMNFIIMFHPANKDIPEPELFKYMGEKWERLEKMFDNFYGSPENTLNTYRKALLERDRSLALECLTPPARETMSDLLNSYGPEISKLPTLKKPFIILEKEKIDDKIMDIKLDIIGKTQPRYSKPVLSDYAIFQSEHPWYRLKNNDGKWEIDFPGKYPSLSITNDPSVKNETVKADLKKIAVGLESYRVDWNRYPVNLVPSLLNPIHYIFSVPEDPYNPGHNYQYTTDTGVLYQLGPKTRWLLWSYGPDKVDNRGLLEYDPTNGTKSSGDIIRLSR